MPTAEEQAFLDWHYRLSDQEKQTFAAHVSSTRRRDADRADADRAARRRQGGLVRSMLTQYGLEDLSRFVDRWVRDDLSWEEIEVQLRDPKTPAGKVFDKMYPEVRLRSEKGLRPMSVAEIQSYRETATQVFRNAGLPQGFYDSPDDFTRFITNDVSPQELEERVMDGFVAVNKAPAEVRTELERLYGVSSGHLAAYFLDPQKATTLIQREVAAAEVSGGAQRAGFGGLDREEAERLASVGVTGDSAVDAFGNLVEAAELFQDLPGSVDGTFARDEQIALLAGDAEARRRAEQRAAGRAATTQGGGGFAASREGFSGFGSAR